MSLDTTELAARLERFDVDVTVDAKRLDAVLRRRHRQRMALGAAGATMCLALAVAVGVNALGASPQPRVDDLTGADGEPAVPPTASEGPYPWSGEDAHPAAQDPQRPWAPGELGRVTFADVAAFALPPAISVIDEPETRGPGLRIVHADTTPFGRGATVVSGHRTTYGAELWSLDEVAAGQDVLVDHPDGTSSTYVVDQIETIASDDDPLSLLPTEREGSRWLVVTTSAPRWSDEQQLVVVASAPASGPTETATDQHPGETVQSLSLDEARRVVPWDFPAPDLTGTSLVWSGEVIVVQRGTEALPHFTVELELTGGAEATGPVDQAGHGRGTTSVLYIASTTGDPGLGPANSALDDGTPAWTDDDGSINFQKGHLYVQISGPPALSELRQLAQSIAAQLPAVR